MNGLLRRFKRGQEGITGLETAIILIAFVIVASVFAYTVLSAGLFSAQKAKEAVHSGLQEARSTVELKGNVLGKIENRVLTELYFTVGVPPGGDSVDFTPPTANTTSFVIISYSDAYQVFPTLSWTMAKLNTTTPDNLLDGNELFQITVDLSSVSANTTDEKKPGPYHTFRLELKPPVGAILTIERTIPARVDEIVNLY
ncbi:MAG: hypothetical protein A2144_13015 [Chloroflexi bacterium RBG_16_50_9]|nr:MAG: hypothetical protein A2144_13015 [Chloroflexi bacterium RBG_16_50_9]